MGTSWPDFNHVLLPPRRPSNPQLANEWTAFVRNELPFRFVSFPRAGELYRQFLLNRFGTLERIRDDLDAIYTSLKQILWPPRNPSPAELSTISQFLRTAGHDEELSVVTPDIRFVAFLRKQYGNDLERLNTDLDTRWESLSAIRPPYIEDDYWEFKQDAGSWLKWFLTRNYVEVIDYIAVRGRALWNTVVLVVAMVFCALTINPLTAYALSRLELSYSNQILLFLLATMAFPHEVAMIPNFLLLRSFPLWTWLIGFTCGILAAGIVLYTTTGARKILAIPVGLGAAVISAFYLTPIAGRLLGIRIGPVSLLNTYAALILPRMASGYGIFLLKGFFDSLPEELFEAGRIDGAGEFWMLWQVAFPLSKPIFAVMALQTFTAIYGSYIWALIVCQDEKMWTLMVYIFQLQQWAPYYVTMAATVLASLPTLLVFIFAQKTIMRGIIIPTYK